MKTDRWIKPFFKQYRGALALALLLGVITFVFASGLMFNSGYLISKAAEAPGNIMVIYVPIALARIFGVGKPILQYFERLVSHDWVFRMTSSLRLKLYRSLETEAMFLRQRFSTGSILGLLAEDIGHIQNLYLRSVFPTAIAWALAFILVVALGFFSLWFALVMFLLLAVVVFLTPLVSVLVNGAKQARRKTMKNDLYHDLTDNVLGVSDWVFSQRHDEYLNDYKKAEQAVRNTDAAINRFSRRRDLVLQAMFGSIVVALLLWAGTAFGGTHGGAANWVAAFVLGFFPLIEAFSPLSQAAVEASNHRDSIERLNELPDEDRKMAKLDALPSDPLTIKIGGVSFVYPSTTKTVLDGLDLEIEQGEKIAILGRSGSGKSTLAALVRGDLSPSEGSVTLGGIPTDHFGDDIAHFIGVIQQQTYLFNTTLMDNLVLGDPDATEAQVWKALEKVGLKEMVARLPEGLETMVDEAGMRFSGGERHRLALARVLLQDTPIVILDEPTVGLDPATEQALLKTIFTTMEEKTLIMITHHLQGTSLMDRVVFIEDGHVELSGDPKKLEKENAYYQKLLSFDRGIF